MKKPRMQVLYAVDVVFPGPHYANGYDDIKPMVMMALKAKAGAHIIHRIQRSVIKEKTLILILRKTRKLDARRIQNELFRLNDLSLSLATIHKVLSTNEVKPLVKRRLKTQYKRYSRPIPGGSSTDGHMQNISRNGEKPFPINYWARQHLIYLNMALID